MEELFCQPPQARKRPLHVWNHSAAWKKQFITSWGAFLVGYFGGMSGKMELEGKCFLLLILQSDSFANVFRTLLFLRQPVHRLLSPLHAVFCLSSLAPSLSPSLFLCPSCMPPLFRNPRAIRYWGTAGSSIPQRLA